jgi:hypothetical protein
MTGRMRLALAGSALALAAVAMFACSSAAPQSSNSAQPIAAPTNKPATPAPSDPIPPPPADAVPVSADPGDGGVPPAPGDGTLPGTLPVPAGNDPGTQCLPDSVKETEPNNDTPNVLPIQPATYCGRLEAGDVDEVSFVMPQSIRSFSYQPEAGFGEVTIEATAGGQPFNPNGAWPFMAGQPYVFKISSPGNLRPVDYRLRFDFQL